MSLIPAEALVRSRPVSARARKADRIRSARPSGPRSLTVSIRAIRSAARMEMPEDREPLVEERPRTRADCATVPRPCPWVGCRYNLFLDVTDGGGIKLNFPDREPEEMRFSCALDLADNGPMTFDAIKLALNLTRQRVEQFEKLTFARLRNFRRAEVEALR